MESCCLNEKVLSLPYKLSYKIRATAAICCIFKQQELALFSTTGKFCLVL